jgi:hypothetical protein
MSSPTQVFTSGPMEWQYLDVYFPTAGVVTPVPHQLTGQFVGWTLVRKSEYSDVKDGPMPVAPGALQLVCNTDGVLATIRVEAVRIPPR